MYDNVWAPPALARCLVPPEGAGGALSTVLRADEEALADWRHGRGAPLSDAQALAGFKAALRAGKCAAAGAGADDGSTPSGYASKHFSHARGSRTTARCWWSCGWSARRTRIRSRRRRMRRTRPRPCSRRHLRARRARRRRLAQRLLPMRAMCAHEPLTACSAARAAARALPPASRAGGSCGAASPA